MDSLHDGQGQHIAGIYPIKNIYQGSAGSTSTTVDLGDTQKIVGIRAKEDAYYLPVSTSSGTVTASTGAWIPSGQEDYHYMGSNQYMAILQDGTGGKVVIKELG